MSGRCEAPDDRVVGADHHGVLRLDGNRRRDIDAWLDAYVAQATDPHPDVLELFSLHPEHIDAAFLAFVRAQHGFDPSSEHGSRLATKVLAQLCQSVLDGKLSVPDFCETVQRLDTTYNEPRSGLSYPQGLSELWHSCDWCDESWSLEEEPQVRELLEEFVASTKADEAPNLPT